MKTIKTLSLSLFLLRSQAKHTLIAHTYRASHQDMGGTELLQPLEMVLGGAAEAGYVRQVFVLTDGEVRVGVQSGWKVSPSLCLCVSRFLSL